jgi:hypothetical protein
MKRNRLIACVLLTIFLISMHGMAGAAVTPDNGAKYTMAGKDMTLDTGGSKFVLKQGESMKVTHAKQTWKLTAKGDAAGYVVVKGDTLDFTYDSAQLLLVGPIVAGGISTTTVAIGAGTAATAGGVAAAVAVSDGYTPPTSPK